MHQNVYAMLPCLQSELSEKHKLSCKLTVLLISLILLLAILSKI